MTTILLSLHRNKFTIHSRTKSGGFDLVIRPDGEATNEIVVAVPKGEEDSFLDRMFKAVSPHLPSYPKPEDFPGGADCQDPPDPTAYVLNKLMPYFDKWDRS